MSMFPELRQDGKLNPLSPEFQPFSDENIGPRPSRHILADRRQDADRAYWTPVNYEDDMEDAGRGHLLGGGRRAQ